MKKSLFVIIGLVLLGQICTAQNSQAAAKVQQNKHILPATVEQNLRGVAVYETQLDSIKAESYCLSFEYDYAGRLTWEKYENTFEPEYSWKSEYVKNAAGLTERINTYSFSQTTSSFFVSCYEEFLYDSLGRKIQRINANYFDSAWQIGGKGNYYYCPDGKLQEYEQLIHMGNNVYDDLSRDLYVYDSTGKLHSISYLYYSSGVWDTSIVDTYTYSGNKLVEIVSKINNAGVWENDHKFEYDYSAAGDCQERRYYLSASASTWGDISERYVWRYNEAQPIDNVLYPREAEFFQGDFTWFDMTNLRTEEDWYTINMNTMLLAYVETGYYFYSPVTGIDDSGSDSELISVFPNPASDKINFSSELNDKDITADIMTIEGKRVASLSSIPENGLSVAGWAKGMYIVVFHSNEMNITPVKFQIQ